MLLSNASVCKFHILISYFVLLLQFESFPGFCYFLANMYGAALFEFGEKELFDLLTVNFSLIQMLIF